MNPFAWSAEHKTALIVGAIIGAMVVVVFGFVYRGLNYGTITSTLFLSASTLRWAILGALLGGGMVYVRRLLQT
jgi:hypothetical protein